MKIYTVFTGDKLKGFWTEQKVAIRYLANRDEEEREAYTLVEIETDSNLNDEVEAEAKTIAESRKAPQGKVHHLHAESIEVTSDGKIL